MDLTFFSGKRVFLTGHTGFKGSWLTLIFKCLGAHVKGLALPAHKHSLYTAAHVDKFIESTVCDIRDSDFVKNSIVEFQPDFIFHFAAQPLVIESYKDPLYTFQVNSLGTANILDAIRGLKNKCAVVVATTDKVYENQDWEYFYRENDKLGGHDPYSMSKVCAELITSSYRDSFFRNGDVDISTCRAGNVIGGGDWSSNRLIPDIVKAFHQNKVVEIRNPTYVRPWQHVLEPLSGYLEVALKSYHDKSFASAWNFGPQFSDQLDVISVVKLFIEYWGGGTYKVVSQRAGDYLETKQLRLDSSKSLTMLDWVPRLNSSEAIKWTCDWYKEYFQHPGKILDYSIDQIMNYFNWK